MDKTLGWVCPNCGVAYAPSITSCACSVIEPSRRGQVGLDQYYETSTQTARLKLPPQPSPEYTVLGQGAYHDITSAKFTFGNWGYQT